MTLCRLYYIIVIGGSCACRRSRRRPSCFGSSYFTRGDAQWNLQPWLKPQRTRSKPQQRPAWLRRMCGRGSALVISVASFVVAAYFYKWVKKLPVRQRPVWKKLGNSSVTAPSPSSSASTASSASSPPWSWCSSCSSSRNPSGMAMRPRTSRWPSSTSLVPSFPALAGYVGISIATLSNVRAATAAQDSIQKSFMAGFRGGAVMGMAVGRHVPGGRRHRLAVHEGA